MRFTTFEVKMYNLTYSNSTKVKKIFYDLNASCFYASSPFEVNVTNINVAGLFFRCNGKSTDYNVTSFYTSAEFEKPI